MTDENEKKEAKKQHKTKTPKDAYGNHDPDKAAPGGYNVAPSLGPIPGVGEDKKDVEDGNIEKQENAGMGPAQKKIMPSDKDNEPKGEPEEDKGGFGAQPDKKTVPEEKQNNPFMPQDAPVKKPKNPKF